GDARHADSPRSAEPSGQRPRLNNQTSARRLPTVAATASPELARLLTSRRGRARMHSHTHSASPHLGGASLETKGFLRWFLLPRAKRPASPSPAFWWPGCLV